MGGILESEETKRSKQINETQAKAAKAIVKLAIKINEENEAKAKAVNDDKTQGDNATTPETTESAPIKKNQETQETDDNNIITTNHKTQNENQQINPSNDHVSTAPNFWNFGTINLIYIK